MAEEINALPEGWVIEEQAALPEGWSIEEQAASKPERGALEKGARVGAQFALGAIEGSPAGFVYDVGVSPANSKGFATFNERVRIGEDLEYLYEKNSGKELKDWPKADQDLYASLEEQIKPGGELTNVPEGVDLSIRGLAQKATGVDLAPEGIAEKAAHWTGFIRDPKKIFELKKTGLNPVDAIKAIAPTGREALRGIGAGTALQMAEEGDFGPIGTMAAAVVGDISGNVGASAAKGIKRIVTEPRQVMAEVAAAFTPKEKLDLQKEIIQDFRDAGLQADIGTSTNNDLIKWVQSRLAQSGLTGTALEDLKKTLKNDIEQQYKTLADSVGEARFATSHEAGEVTKGLLKDIRETDLKEVRELYKEADNSIKEASHVDTKKLAAEIERLETKLKPGSLKSGEQKAVLDTLQTIKRDIYDSNGSLLYGKVKDLMNNKIALNDVINYEVKGGAKELLKGVVGELDRAIISHGKDNPRFAKNYIKANKQFSKHAKEFRNKRVAQLLADNDPAQLLNKMNSVQGIKDLEAILHKSQAGTTVMNNLKRFKLDRMISDNMVDSTTQQIKLGTFSKLLEKGKNRDLAKELLPKNSFKRLERLQRNSGRLADTANKFLNSSKSGVTLEDAGVVAKVFNDLSSILAGNPWPIIRTTAGVTGARYLTKLMGDASFLRLVEEMILATQKNDTGLMTRLAKQIAEPVKAAIAEESKNTSQDSDQQKR